MSFSPLYRDNLETQGFRCSEENFSAIAGWLRLNPAICIMLIMIGLILQSAAVFFILAAVAFLGLILPHSPGDYIYLYLVRPITKSASLPRTPPPRRFACLIGTLWALAAALSFMVGAPMLATALAIVFILVAFPMATIHLCVASVIYQKLIGYRPRLSP